MASFRSLRWWVTARRHPSALLLAVQLAGVLLYPVMEETVRGRTLFGAFGMLVLALALWVVNRSPSINWIAWCLAIPAVVLSLLSAWSGQPGLLVYAHLLEGALYFYTAASLTAYMLQDHEVTRDELFAAGATFTLLAWGFGYAYFACQAWYPGSFTGFEPERPRTWMELLFYSFSNLSATGLGDVLPVSSPARVLTMLEQFAGVGYIATVVSHLIGLTIVRQERSDQ